ncbi:MAG: ATP-dependent 6-phosphofructokinase [Ignavibacteria bacterium]|nr:ATP-dependent 6-phosphofructokinase [Ignavibacteria bacterium]
MNEDFKIPVVGKPAIKSPLLLSKVEGDGVFDYIESSDRVLYDPTLDNFYKSKNENTEPLSFEKAGPKEFIYFDPPKTKVAIVTCGGLCPGLNNVIRSIVLQLYYRYKVTRVIGIKYGYEGFIPEYNHPIIDLTPEVVERIHLFGGTLLGSSRGKQDVCQIVDSLERMNVNILFTIGGDGTLRGALAIKEEIEKRNLKIAVAGIPKTIDNDIGYISKSFGFETAYSIAEAIVHVAHNEAIGAYNGITIVKLMGRHSGFIAANAALSTQDTNFVLIPEMDFDLEGENGFLEALKKRILQRHHALIVVAEGAGQHIFEGEPKKYDESGNLLNKDIGLHLKSVIDEFFKSLDIRVSIKYIDPSYIIRSARAIADDSKFCLQLSQNAVHAAMAGKTGFVVGYWNGQFTLLPISLAVRERQKINLESELWWNVLEVTGQPVSMKN